MSGDKYIISDQHAPYFLTCTVIHWIDVFTRKDYRDIVVNSLNYCVENKGLKIYAWVIMSNHIHLVCQVDEPFGMSGVLRDFKKHTSREILKRIQEIPESRRDWLLDKFSFEARKTGRAEFFKLWTDDNHAIDLTRINIFQKIDYVHENPVRAGWVEFPEHYLYSSAKDYAGEKGLVKIVVI